MVRERVSRRDFVKDTATTAATAAGLAMTGGIQSARADAATEVEKTRSFNPGMEYRRLGQTGLWVSAVCLGGHWKRIDKVIAADGPLNPYLAPREELMGPFMTNRHEVVSRCIEVGINLIDLAGDSEPDVYYRVLQGRRDAMYMAYSHPRSELRPPENRRADKLLELFKQGLKRVGVEYADIWRLMALERGGRHSQEDVEEMITALEKAREQGLCRFTGISTHDRRWAQMLMETYPEVIQMICIPYTSNTKVLPEDSMLDTAVKLDVGILGIKPFASNSLFQGDGSPDGPHVEADNRIARMAIRYILNNPAITAPIPGLISPAQVDNMTLAIQERRQLDLAERAELDRASKRAWANLPQQYQWLKDWEYV